MSELNGLIQTHKHCPKCGVLVPVKFLSCPACAGFTKKREQWVAQSKPRPKRAPTQEQTLWLDESGYPA